MKYKNVDIGDKPTKEQFQEYVYQKGFKAALAINPTGL